jgi:hypothetical protein
MWQEPSLSYRRMVRERWIIRRWTRWAWFRAADFCQELGRLSKPGRRCHVARGYRRCREKRAWRVECL